MSECFNDLMVRVAHWEHAFERRHKRKPRLSERQHWLLGEISRLRVELDRRIAEFDLEEELRRFPHLRRTS